MKRRIPLKGVRFSQERIIGILKEADCKTSTIGELCRKHGVSEQTFYRWRRKYGGLSVSEKRFKRTCLTGLEKKTGPVTTDHWDTTDLDTKDNEARGPFSGNELLSSHPVRNSDIRENGQKQRPV